MNKIRDCVDTLDGVITEFLYEEETKVVDHIFKSFYEFKEGIKGIFQIEWSKITAEYEDDDAFWRQIKNEDDYFEALQWADGIRLTIRVSFDKADTIKPVVQPAIEVNPQNTEKPWKCKRCSASNDSNLLKCRACNLVKK